MDFLFGNSMTQRQIENATSELLLSSDWSANLEIVDAVNRDPEGGKEVLKAIQKRMKHSNHHVANLALDLLNTCVKNCGENFHRNVAKQDFLDDVARVALIPNQHAEVRDKALTLILSWAEAFAKHPEFTSFWHTYQQLRARNIEFPARDMNEMAPVFTPAAKPELQRKSSQNDDVKQEVKSFNYSEKLKTDLRQVLDYLTVFRDAIAAANNDAQALKSNDIATQLSKLLKDIQTRLMNILVELEYEQLVVICILVNDHVSHALSKYRAVLVAQPFDAPEPPAVTGLDDNPSVEKKEEKQGVANIINLDEPIALNEDPSDEFAQLAISRHAQSEDEPGKKSAEQELEDLLSGEGSNNNNNNNNNNNQSVNISSQEFDELLALAQPQKQ